MTLLDHELGWLLEQEVFSVDGAPYSWGDVLMSAELRGALAELVAATRHRLASAEGNEPSSEAVREAASRFRYQRRLLSAEELEAWLERWRLSVADWTEHLRRLLPSEHRAGELEQTEAAAELQKAVAVDAICTGFLEREAKQLATDAALAEIDVCATDDRRARIEQIVASAASARGALAAAADVEREIDARALEWTRIDAELLELADADAAREAALCVRVDGRSLAEVAADCGVPVERRELYLDEAEHERLTGLLGANAGELVGPIEREDGFLLVHVHGRKRPSAEDPEVRRRAQAHLVERATERAFEARVRWA
jgi:hypothetical protein